ncbi:hypothetical protein JM18_008216 [Phytophthora kernoviae]|uniref:choline-phosphate cytidylyltransferase n=2 Tax=Phytophthora kernoviae TaxID=325452 RepID=A0A921V3V7_9STRA|nr:hypothetical protein JM18_008216 [Phytophthora kernoviae]
MTINHAVQPGDSSGSVLVASLASRHFRPGGVVKGVIRLVSHQASPDARSEIAHVVAQVHGHVTVDSNLLTLPVVHVQSPRAASQEERAQLEHNLSEDVVPFYKTGASLPDVRTFSGDTGTCIFRSAPSVLLSDINIAPTPSELTAAASKIHGATDEVIEAAREETAERCTREFAIALPENICPTFRGSSARVFYVVSITAQCALNDSKPVSVHLPFEVYGSEYFFVPNTVASANQIAATHSKDDGVTGSTGNSIENAPHKDPVVGGSSRVGRPDRSVSFSPAPVGVRNGSEIAFELRPSLMHGRVETELMQRAQTSIFTIGKDSSHLVRFLLTKQFYQPGEVLLGVFDFTRASIPCYEVSATLCLEETLSSMALDPDRVVQSKVFGSFRERTLGVLQTNMRFSIPHDALPTIRTDLVRFQWLLRFEFSAGAPPQGQSGGAAQRQTFQWQVPIVVQPMVTTERNQLANVPHKLFSGSTRRRATEMNHEEEVEEDHHAPSSEEEAKPSADSAKDTASNSSQEGDGELQPEPEPYRKTLVEGEPGTKTGRPLRLYADGIFDLFHFGHAKALQQCKEAYPNTYLIVGCCSDEITHKLKGRTVMTDKERYESLRHCKWVDEVVEDAPWVLSDEFLEKHQIDYVCHDALPYSDTSGEASEGDVYARIKAMGKFLETRRTDGISTSDLIIRIIAQYDTFIRRNLQRGYSGKDMNVPFIKEKTIKFDMAVDKVRNDVDLFVHKWINKADEMQHGFTELFSKEGRLRTSFRKRRKIIKERLSERMSEMAREGLC